MTEENDPLAAWRNIGPRLPALSGGKEAYTAFDNPVDRPPSRLHLCPLEHEAWEWMPYMDLQRIVHDGPHGTRLGLIWAYAVVVIKGRNLQQLDRHLAHEAVAEVRAFDPKRFHAPSDPALPFIDSITVITESRKTMMEAEMALISEIEHRH
jgi:hypothetical protein